MNRFLAGVAGLFVFSPASWAFNYESAFTCMKALTEISQNPPVVFNRAGTGVYLTNVAGTSGFLVMTPKSPWFFPQAEMTTSGDAGSAQTKISVIVPESDVLKVFYNPAGSTPQQQVTFGVANEFDRQIEASPVTADVSEANLNLLISRTLFRARQLILTANKAPLGKALDKCSGINWDFPVELGNGTEGKWVSEVKMIRDKLKPSVFSMEYWFPKKGPAAN